MRPSLYWRIVCKLHDKHKCASKNSCPVVYKQTLSQLTKYTTAVSEEFVNIAAESSSFKCRLIKVDLNNSFLSWNIDYVNGV